MNSYAQMINKFTKEFTTDYCKETGESYSGFQIAFEPCSKDIRNAYEPISVHKIN